MYHRTVALCTFLVLLSAHYSSISALPYDARIVGGNNADVGQFPYLASLQSDGGEHICGGSILNERFILTAAHCVVVNNGLSPYPVQYYQVRVGSIQRNAAGKMLRLKRIIVNKSYGNFLNDIALLELEAPLVWTANIQPIALAVAEVPSGADVTISGWGQIYPSDPSPYRSQWSTLKAEECTDWNFDSLICLGHEADKGICSGDAGGPAVYEDKLVGVASFYTGGCASDKPDIYTKVLHYHEWILENIGE